MYAVIIANAIGGKRRVRGSRGLVVGWDGMAVGVGNSALAENLMAMRAWAQPRSEGVLERASEDCDRLKSIAILKRASQFLQTPRAVGCHRGLASPPFG